MTTIIDYLTGNIYYGFIIITIVISLWKKSTNTFHLDRTILISSNNLLILCWTIMIFLNILFLFLKDWLSQVDHVQYVSSNLLGIPYGIFILLVSVKYLSPLMMLRKQIRQKISSSLFIIGIWILAYLVSLVIEALTEKSDLISSGWQIGLTGNLYLFFVNGLFYISLLAIVYIVEKRKKNVAYYQV